MKRKQLPYNITGINTKSLKQHGAFVAGFLKGWRERTDAPMPAMDIVIGISTGDDPWVLLPPGPFE